MAYNVAKVIETNNTASKIWKIFRKGRLKDFGKFDGMVHYPNKENRP
ncbi:hypothetical protein V12G01_11333 [Vibrio alginolyticus 12G01]|nr:hypothetical protein V12G01_11333 [Vibrio alginolyticus 12G01]